MNRTELTFLVAATFMIAILIGWTLRWIFTRINQSGLNNIGSNDLAARLHTAEEERDAAFADKEAVVREVQNKLVQTEAELAAAMEGLGDARREANDLRMEIADLKN